MNTVQFDFGLCSVHVTACIDYTIIGQFHRTISSSNDDVARSENTITFKKWFASLSMKYPVYIPIENDEMLNNLKSFFPGLIFMPVQLGVHKIYKPCTISKEYLDEWKKEIETYDHNAVVPSAVDNNVSTIADEEIVRFLHSQMTKSSSNDDSQE